jgi:hypothetical protein
MNIVATQESRMPAIDAGIFISAQGFQNVKTAEMND